MTNVIPIRRDFVRDRHGNAYAERVPGPEPEVRRSFGERVEWHMSRGVAKLVREEVFKHGGVNGPGYETRDLVEIFGEVRRRALEAYARGKYEERGRLKFWLYSIARRVIADVGTRTDKIRAHELVLEDVIFPHDTYSGEADEDVRPIENLDGTAGEPSAMQKKSREENLCQEAVDLVMHSLSLEICTAGEAQALFLILGGLTFDQAAAHLDISSAAFADRVLRAKRRLRANKYALTAALPFLRASTRRANGIEFTRCAKDGTHATTPDGERFDVDAARETLFRFIQPLPKETDQ